MKQGYSRSKARARCAGGLFCLFLLASGAYGQENRTNAVTAKPASDTRNVTVGSFNMELPTDWTAFASGDAAALRRQYLEQSKQIYQQFSGGGNDPAGAVDIAAYHIKGDDSALMVVAFTIPPQSDLLNLLTSQAKEKADWGIQNGYIRKYLGLVPVNDGQLSGFYIKTIGKSGNVEVSGGLEHIKLKNTLIQITMLCPQDWDIDEAVNTLTPILKSVSLNVN